MVLNPLEPFPLRRRFFRHECASKPMTIDQVPGNVTKLGRIVFMDEENVHANWLGFVGDAANLGENSRAAFG